MHCAAGQTPDQKSVDRTERQLSRRRLPAQFRVLTEQPGQFGAGEIGIEYQAGFFTKAVLQTTILQFPADFGAASALPDDGVMRRPTVGALPKQSSYNFV